MYISGVGAQFHSAEPVLLPTSTEQPCQVDANIAGNAVLGSKTSSPSGGAKSASRHLNPEAEWFFPTLGNSKSDKTYDDDLGIGKDLPEDERIWTMMRDASSAPTYFKTYAAAASGTKSVGRLEDSIEVLSFKCGKCRQFFDIRSQKIHLCSLHYCHICMQGFDTEKELQRHLKHHNRSDNYIGPYPIRVPSSAGETLFHKNPSTPHPTRVSSPLIEELRTPTPTPRFTQTRFSAVDREVYPLPSVPHPTRKPSPAAEKRNGHYGKSEYENIVHQGHDHAPSKKFQYVGASSWLRPVATKSPRNSRIPIVSAATNTDDYPSKGNHDAHTTFLTSDQTSGTAPLHEDEDDYMSRSSESDVSLGRSSVQMSLVTKSLAPSKLYTQPTTADSRQPAPYFALSEDFADSEADSIQTDGRSDGLPSDIRVQFASLFASEILDNLEESNQAHYTVSILSGLLFEYSLLLDARAKLTFQREASTFVRHRRYMISRLLQKTEPDNQIKSDALSFRDKIGLLWAKEGSEGVPTDIDLSALDETDDHDASLVYPDFGQARAFLLGGIEFSWLLSRLRATSSTAVHGDDVFTQVRRNLIKACYDRETLALNVDWCPLQFLREQYDSTNSPSLESMICIVGNHSTADATTCGAYISQTWPLFGPEALRLLDQALKVAISKGASTFNIRSEKGLELTIVFDDGERMRLIVKSSHLPYLVEVGEVVSWLSASCRSSKQHNILNASNPVLQVSEGSHLVEVRNEIYEVSDSIEESKVHNAGGSENCWQRIFNNAAITYGYPILHRASDEKGLRISLEMMATLACTYYATVYDNALLLKGLCSMFVPVLRTPSSVVWHYLLNDDLSWMSHDQAKANCSEIASIDFATLAEAKHFVGWSRQTHTSIGTEATSYDSIGYSGSGNAKSGFALDGITIGFSKVIELSTKITPGKKDSRVLRAFGGPYPRMIRIASTMNVLFYDGKAKRGWLIDGASALLHLSRAALTSPHAPELDSGSLLPPHRQLQHLDHPGGVQKSAADVLLKKHNRDIVLYEDDDAPWFFKDLVLQIWAVLDEMRSRALEAPSLEAAGWNLGSLGSSRLGGFEFADIISGRSIRSRSTKIEDSGTNWLPLITESGTVTIFGGSFGELIRPSQFKCKHCVDVPYGASLLAAPVKRLYSIATEFGEVDDDCWKLVPGLFWNEPYKSFPTAPCGCVQTGRGATCGKLITELQGQRRKLFKGKRRKAEDVLETCVTGAVIIGSSSALKKISSRPQNSGTLSPTQTMTSTASDSGIDMGSSLSTTSTRSSG